MPRLRVLAGPSLDELVSISHVVNRNLSFPIKSEFFAGEIIANIKGFTDDDGNVVGSEYFERDDRQGITWSIQVQGRFLKPHNADDILFGNTFDHPLHLPWGSNIALRFMKLIDPTLDHDLTSSSKPWALSPLISTMPHFAHTRISSECSASPSSSPEALSHMSDTELPPFPSTVSLSDDTSELYLAVTTPSSSASSSESSLLSRRSSTSSLTSVSSLPADGRSGFTSIKSAGVSGFRRKIPKPMAFKKDRSSLQFSNASQRRSYFGSVQHRKEIVFGPNDVITTDFCYGFIEFSPSLSLKLPGGVSFDLQKYWDGQPVRFVCCERKDPAENNGVPWGRILWCVIVESCDDS